MTVIPFDPRRQRPAGRSNGQARKPATEDVEALARALASGQLATKADLVAPRHDLDALRYEFEARLHALKRSLVVQFAIALAVASLLTIAVCGWLVLRLASF